MNVFVWNFRGLGSFLAVHILTDEVKAKDPTLVFLAETKAGVSRMKGIQSKLPYTQGIIVPSNGRSGGIALLWKEGTDIRFKSCSNSHIDVVVHGVHSFVPWHATRFYGQPDSGKRDISWKLLDSLRAQCDMPWVVFNDFNEITQSDEKLGGLERDARQMGVFRDGLSRCGLFDLGFIGQKFTWCNGRFGKQRTHLRLDIILANDGWSVNFLEARVFHSSMPISNHCLLILHLSKGQPQKPMKKRFLFEAMWIRDLRCREVVESAWDPVRGEPNDQITNQLQRCKEQLQRWNWKEFKNVNYLLKQKREHLQQLESLNSLHEEAEEIQNLKKEINEVLTREEIMWSQRSRAMWIKWGDRNTKFFHAIASQRCRKNCIMGLKDLVGKCREDQKGIERTILDYFSSIFKSDHPTSFEASLNAISTTMSSKMNEILTA